MQHGGHQTLMVHMHVAENAGYGQGMGNVWFAATAELTIVRLLGIKVCPAHVVDLFGGQIT